MYYLLLYALSFNCMVDAMSNASGTEIKKSKKEWKIIKAYPEKRKRLEGLLKHSWKYNDVDSRILAISWIESRLRPNVRTGDRGKACGTFQIHARYSYPMFRRKGGFRNWKENKFQKQIKSECNKLRKVKYSVNTMQRLLKMMDKKDLHACHHNSGFYGRCNTWYKKRVDFWINYFNFSKVACKQNNEPIKVKNALFIYNVKNKVIRAFKKYL